MTIHAFTETTGKPYPGYINVSASEKGAVVTVRTPGFDGNRSASLDMTQLELLSLAKAIIDHCGEMP